MYHESARGVDEGMMNVQYFIIVIIIIIIIRGCTEICEDFQTRLLICDCFRFIQGSMLPLP